MAPGAATAALLENLLDTQILRPYLRQTDSDTLGTGDQQLDLTSPPGGSDAESLL